MIESVGEGVEEGGAVEVSERWHGLWKERQCIWSVGVEMTLDGRVRRFRVESRPNGSIGVGVHRKERLGERLVGDG